MRYWAAYSFAFEGPRWWANVLAGAVCLLVPVAGQMVFLGFLAEYVQIMHRSGPSQRVAFDMNRFVQYILRGAWVFLVGFVVSLIFMPVVAVLMGLPMLVAAVLFQGQDAALVCGVIAGALLIMLGSLAMMVVYSPMVLRAGLTQSFEGGFSMEFLSDFIRRCWGETLLVSLFLTLTAIPLVIAGYACCFIGVYPVVAILMIAQWHLFYQLYELYLHRGGMEIPLKEPAAAPQVLPMDSAGT